MRDTKQMLELILRAAREDKRIRAVLLQGSRADPDAEPDIFQDFDVVYLVDGIDSLRADPAWIDQFGERIIMQTPEDMVTPPPVDDGRYSYLMLLADGNRIDLTLLQILREELARMLSWHIGIKTGFSRSLGSHGRHVARELEPELLRLLHATYSDADYESTWDSLFAMCELVRSLAVAIADRCGFEYPVRDDEKTTAHLKHVRSLPGDARDIY